MAREKCKRCGETLPDARGVCGHCGYEKPDTQQRLIWLGLVVVAAFAFARLMPSGDQADEAEQQAGSVATYPATSFHIIGREKIGTAIQSREALRIRIESPAEPTRTEYEEIGKYAWSKASGHLDELVLWFYLTGQDHKGPACVTAEYGPGGLKSYSRLDAVCAR